MVKQNSILIVIDHCRNIIESGKKIFKKMLKYIIENTNYLEFIVVSRDKEDIKDFKLKVSIKID